MIVYLFIYWYIFVYLRLMNTGQCFQRPRIMIYFFRHNSHGLTMPCFCYFLKSIFLTSNLGQVSYSVGRGLSPPTLARKWVQFTTWTTKWVKSGENHVNFGILVVFQFKKDQHLQLIWGKSLTSKLGCQRRDV